MNLLQGMVEKIHFSSDCYIILLLCKVFGLFLTIGLKAMRFFVDELFTKYTTIV